MVSQLENKLDLDRSQVDLARETAGRIADKLHFWIGDYTTTTTERAAARLLGIDGVDKDAVPLANVVIDVWQSDSEGFYDVQKELEGASLRARFTTDDQGRYAFWTVTPSPYPIPTDGPVGKMLEITGRHPYRPAHVHFMLMAEGFETLVTQVFAEDDPYLDSDAVFGVKDSLVREYQLLPPGKAPDGRSMDVPFRHLTYDFGLKASR